MQCKLWVLGTLCRTVESSLLNLTRIQLPRILRWTDCRIGSKTLSIHCIVVFLLE